MHYRKLPNGRFRYNGEIDEARKMGEMSGRRTVREWNPESGIKRTWHETLDYNGNVRIVRPQINEIKIHFLFDVEGKYIGTR